MTTQKTKPEFLVTDDRFSRETYVLFTGFDISECVIDEWVDDEYARRREDSCTYDYDLETVYDESITIDTVREDMYQDFMQSLTTIEHDYGDYVVVNNDEYYRYWPSGETVYAGEFSSIDECRELNQ